MSVYLDIGGVIHTLSGTVTATPVTPPPSGIPPRDNVEITPILTAATGNGYTASASSEYSEAGTTASAWKAFDKVTGNGWAIGWSSTAQATSLAPQTLQIDLPSAKPCYSYKLTNRADANTLCPLAWAFEGWDGAAWVALHSVSGASWANGETKSFDVTTPGVFTKYRWRVTDSGYYCQIAEAKIFS